MAGEKLVELIRKSAKAAIPESSLSNILFGKVVSSSPLEILIENRFKVGSSFLTLSPFCFEKKINITISGHTHTVTAKNHTVPKHKHKIKEDAEEETKDNDSVDLSHNISLSSTDKQNIEVKIWSGLQVGDTVRLLRFANGQQFYILDKGDSI